MLYLLLYLLLLYLLLYYYYYIYYCYIYYYIYYYISCYYRMNCVVVWMTTVRLLLTRTVVCWMRTSTSVPRRLRKVSHGAPAIKEGGNVLFNDKLNTFYFTVIWRRTCGK